jgi:hypothetical protein
MDSLLDSLRAFLIPQGEASASAIRGVKITEEGEMHSSPGSKSIPFTAEQTISAVQSEFRWDARLQTGPIKTLFVTDAYEKGNGFLIAKVAGFIPVANLRGPDFDKGEIQRYLASIPMCPAALFNHTSLEWTSIAPQILRVRDRKDPTEATVNLEIDAEGRPVACRADRPRLVGKRAILTPWSGIFSDFKEYSGLRIPSRLKVLWHLPETEYVYFQSEIRSFEVL